MKVKFIGLQTHASPGSTVRVFGYDAIAQPDKSIICDMHEDQAQAEIKAGRVKPAEDFSDHSTPTQQQIQLPFENEVTVLDGYTTDSNQFFGFDSLEELKNRLKKETVPTLKTFSLHMLRVEMPNHIRKDDLRAEIFSILDNMYGVDQR